MRISYWSSDVCSSDLRQRGSPGRSAAGHPAGRSRREGRVLPSPGSAGGERAGRDHAVPPAQGARRLLRGCETLSVTCSVSLPARRTEEGRCRKECASTCKNWGEPGHHKKKTKR